jgi:hypothetical protein
MQLNIYNEPGNCQGNCNHKIHWQLIHWQLIHWHVYIRRDTIIGGL